MTVQHGDYLYEQFLFDATSATLDPDTMALGSDTTSSINLIRQYYFSVSGITWKISSIIAEALYICWTTGGGSCCELVSTRDKATDVFV